ncbi:hypothetical protein [Nonomuraea sp. NPDC049400]|uniref:hypothetical protein n=1 Tax=Nonomuraea sp. NPDC049400 TaxID=3364352 RepID=UPI003793E9E2
MSTATLPSQTVTSHWGTAIVVDHIDVTGILHYVLPAGLGTGSIPVEEIPIDQVIADAEPLRVEFLASMNAIAEAHDEPPVLDLDLTVQLWQAGYDDPMISHPARIVAWCFLACSEAPPNTESGALAFPDPRNASSQTAMPGLPWGRQLMVRPVPGAHVAAPGWTTWAVVPLARGQYSLVAFATAR